ncbi:MAG: hypothetical protein ABIH36_03890 [bacterium]
MTATTLTVLAIVFAPTAIITARLLIELLHHQQSPSHTNHFTSPYVDRWLHEHPEPDRATDLLKKLHFEIKRNQHPEYIEAIEETLQTELAQKGKYWYFVPLERSR